MPTQVGAGASAGVERTEPLAGRARSVRKGKKETDLHWLDDTVRDSAATRIWPQAEEIPLDDV